MKSIVFIDTEVSLKRQEILDIGGIKDNGSSFHSSSTSEFISFINGTRFICGHNILSHDLKYTDINLGYFEYRQNQINRLISGDNLVIGNDGCFTNNGDVVLKFSKKFNETISKLKDQGYHLKNARINFILFWKNSEKETEFKIILPELDFENK